MLGPAFLPFLGVFSPQRGEGTQQRKISEKERKEEITMEKIASFTIDHIKLQPGVYTRILETRQYTLDRWAAEPVFICF